jgi:hypothetical protein
LLHLSSFLSPPDAARAAATLARLDRHGFTQTVLTGGLAVEAHCAFGGGTARPRAFTDIDFLVAEFDQIPCSLASDFLFRHVHPDDPPAKTLLQAVDPRSAVRVDVFRAYGREIERAILLPLESMRRAIGIEDLVARAARLCLDLADGNPVPAKHAFDFLRLLPLAVALNLEEIWREHRKPSHPETFREAASLLSELIRSRTDLLREVTFSRDPEQACARCAATGSFPLADPRRIVAILGYC